MFNSKIFFIVYIKFKNSFLYSLILTYVVHGKLKISSVKTQNEQLLGRKPDMHNHLAWSEDPILLREFYALFPKLVLFNNKKPFFINY